jgi:uncharacterized delta-60 repeat protein
VITDFSPASGTAQGVAVQADGRIVAAGGIFNGGNQQFALARYNSNGSPDTSFGGTGLVTTSFGGTHDGALSVAVQADGKIVAAGSTQTAHSGEQFALARYSSNGSLDPSFGTGGRVTTTFGGDGRLDRAQSVAVQADGRIVAAGFTQTDSGKKFALARYNSNGSLDTSFGPGVVTTSFGGTDDIVPLVRNRLRFP